MFNKTNESTIVETTLAISGLAMVFIHGQARYRVIYASHNFIIHIIYYG